MFSTHEETLLDDKLIFNCESIERHDWIENEPNMKEKNEMKLNIETQTTKRQIPIQKILIE